MATTRDLPIGIKIIRNLLGSRQLNWNKDFWFRFLVLFLTFISYMSYHFTRKPISVVKSVLHPNCTGDPNNHGSSNCSGWPPFAYGWPTEFRSNKVELSNSLSSWAPQHLEVELSNNLKTKNYSIYEKVKTHYGDNAGKLFGTLDSAFLFAYAFAMFVSGVVAERVNLRYFLSLGMIMSGLFCYLFGIAKSLNIHSLAYFIIVQILMGVFQTTGWPAVVSVVGQWFGKGKRGLIFGIWNSHTSLGNIVGTLIAGYFVETNWGYSFIVPGFLMAVFGFLVFLFLVTHPEDVGCSPPQPVNRAGVNNSTTYVTLPQKEESSSDEDSENDTRVVLGASAPYRRNKNSVTEKSPILVTMSDNAIGFIDALKIPGVVEFSLSLFFSKLVSYTFLYWLPYYIGSSTKFSPSLSAELSTLFDVGGIIGAIVAGLITDASNMSATVCVVMLFLAVPSLFLYEAYGSLNENVNILLLLISGAFVNGPYSLITTAVSAELGTHESLQGSSRALATVTAIIDGTGSIGAAVGPLIAGLVSPIGWDKVFYFLMASDVAALLLLVRLMIKEISKFRNMRHRLRALSA